MISYSGNFFFAESINDINSILWNKCVGLDHPFTRYEFLSALENSESANSKTGWKAFHYIEKNEKNEIIAICPLYIKNHSFGEYIFDHSWADAYHRHGLNYYPKLQSAIPSLQLLGKEYSCIKKLRTNLKKNLKLLKR